MSQLDQIRDLIAEDEMDKALSQFKEYLDSNRPDLSPDWLNVSNRYNNLEREIRRDTISFAEAGRTRSQIVNAFMALLEIAERPEPEIIDSKPKTGLGIADRIRLEGFEKAKNNLVEKLTMLMDAHSTASEGSKKFELKKDIERTEKELNDLEAKIKELNS